RDEAQPVALLDVVGVGGGHLLLFLWRRFLGDHAGHGFGGGGLLVELVVVVLGILLDDLDGDAPLAAHGLGVEAHRLPLLHLLEPVLAPLLVLLPLAVRRLGGGARL